MQGTVLESGAATPVGVSSAVFPGVRVDQFTKPATTLMVTATMVVPNTNDNSA